MVWVRRLGGYEKPSESPGRRAGGIKRMNPDPNGPTLPSFAIKLMVRVGGERLNSTESAEASRYKSAEKEVTNGSLAELAVEYQGKVFT